MNPDTAIQLGILILTAVSLAAAAVVAVRRAWHRRHGVSLDILERKRDLTYIYGVSCREQVMCVDSATLAVHIRIANNTDQPFLVCDIHAHEDGTPRRPVLVPPHRDARFSEEGAIFEAPIRLPFTVAPGEGVSFWTVVDAMIPSDLGQLLFELYGEKARTDATVMELAGRLKRLSTLNEHMISHGGSSKLEKAFGIHIIGATIHKVATHLSVEEITKDKSEVRARFGVLPKTAIVEVLSRINSEASSVSSISTDSDKFHIGFVIGAGDMRRISINTRLSALWFL